MGGGSCSKGHRFKSQHRILDETRHFSHWFVITRTTTRTTTQVITRYFGRWPQTKIAMMLVWKDRKNKKSPGMTHLKNTFSAMKICGPKVITSSWVVNCFETFFEVGNHWRRETRQQFKVLFKQPLKVAPKRLHLPRQNDFYTDAKFVNCSFQLFVIGFSINW